MKLGINSKKPKKEKAETAAAGDVLKNTPKKTQVKPAAQGQTNSDENNPKQYTAEAAEKVKKSRNYDEMHAKILETLLELISQKGFKSTTTREIAASAGITEVTLYRHFSSKEEMFAEVAEKYTAVGLLHKLPPEIEKLPFKKKLNLITRKLLEVFKKQSKVFRIMLSESMMHPQQAKMHFEKVPFQIIIKVSEFFQEEIDAGRINPSLKPRLMARALLGMFISYTLLQEMLYGKEFESFDFDEVIDNYLEIFLNGVLKK
ncbi:MAG: TetR/AcrR family transcriptional regulator [Candidatus Wallbacteria bacterium]